MAAVAAAGKSGNDRPVEVTSKVAVMLDGQQIHEAVTKAGQQSAGRGFAPTGAPT